MLSHNKLTQPAPRHSPVLKLIAQVHEKKDMIRDLTTQLESSQKENSHLENQNTASLKTCDTLHELIRSSKLKYEFQIDIMRQYSNFQNFGSQKRFFRDKINQGTLSHFEAKDKKIKKKVENLKNQVTKYVRKSNALSIKANEKKHII